MPEDDNQQQQPAADHAESIRRLEEKNRELIGELRAARKKAEQVPDGVNVQELIEFKQRHETERLESAGNYEQAKQQLQAQYDTDTQQLRGQVENLQARIRELELVSPAVSALSEQIGRAHV